MIDKPLYENPLAGGAITKQKGPFDLSKINKNPYNSEFIGIGKDQTNLFGYKVPDYVIKEQEERMKNNPINMYNMTPPGELGDILLSDPQGSDQLNADQEFLKTADEYQRGFRESEFYKPNAPMTADMAEFIYKSPTGEDITMKGSSSGIGQFGSYLDSIGKGDLLQRAGGSFSQDLLGKVNPNDPSQQLLDGTTSVNPIVSDPSSAIASINGPGLLEGPPVFRTPGLPPPEAPSPDTIVSPLQPMSPSETNPYQEQFTGFQNQLTGFNDQFSSMGDRLTKLEEGIASLLNQNRGFGFNSMQPRYGAPNYGYSPFSMTGLGSLFGGYYG